MPSPGAKAPAPLKSKFATMITEAQLQKSTNPRVKELLEILQGYGERYNKRAQQINAHLSQMIAGLSSPTSGIAVELGRSYCYIRFFESGKDRHSGEFIPEVTFSSARVKKGSVIELEKDYYNIGLMLISSINNDYTGFYAELEKFSRELILSSRDAQLAAYQKELEQIIKAEEQAEENEKLSAILSKLTPGATFLPNEKTRNRVSAKAIYRKESPKFFYFDIYLRPESPYFSRQERVKREHIIEFFDSEWNLNSVTNQSK